MMEGVVKCPWATWIKGRWGYLAVLNGLGTLEAPQSAKGKTN